jgi:type VI secretion system protein ImpA
LIDIDRTVSGGTGDGGQVLTAAQIQAAFRGTKPESLRVVYDAIVDAEVAVKELDSLLTRAVGASRAVAFDALAGTLKDLQKAVAPFAGSATSSSDALTANGEAESGSSQAAGAGSSISGEVRSREDVVRVIDQICDFFRRAEPSSPVPLLLQRARRLVNLDFVELMNDLAPESLTQIRNIAGIRDDSGGGASETVAE